MSFNTFNHSADFWEVCNPSIADIIKNRRSDFRFSDESENWNELFICKSHRQQQQHCSRCKTGNGKHNNSHNFWVLCFCLPKLNDVFCFRQQRVAIGKIESKSHMLDEWISIKIIELTDSLSTVCFLSVPLCSSERVTVSAKSTSYFCQWHEKISKQSKAQQPMKANWVCCVDFFCSFLITAAVAWRDGW